MRLRPPDPFVLVLAVLGVAVLVLLGPWADDADPVEVRVAGTVHRVTTTSSAPSTTTTTAAPTTTTTRPARRLLGEFRVTCYGLPLFPRGQVTRSGAPVGPGSIAVDPRVIPLGTVLEVEGYGRGVANDTGSAVNGRHVDLWVEHPTPCTVGPRARVWVIDR